MLRAPSWVWKEHHQQMWALSRCRSQSLCCLLSGSSAPCYFALTLELSLDPASIWGPGSSLLTGSLLEALLWWTQGHPTAPAWVDLRPGMVPAVVPWMVANKGSIWAKKENIQWGGRRMAAHVGEWRTRLQEGLRDREGGCNQRE